MTDIELEVGGYPPLKNEARSLLGAGHGQAERVRRLLEAAAAATAGRSDLPLQGPLGVEVLVRSPEGARRGEAMSFLGGIADTLRDKARIALDLSHLGPLAKVALFTDDGQLAELEYRSAVAAEPSYRLRIWRLAAAARGEDRAVDVEVDATAERSPEFAFGTQVVAVDWSGRRDGGQGHNYVAERLRTGEIRLTPDLSRDAIVADLAARAASQRDLLVGLDFAFSLPAAFARSHGAATIEEVWALVEREGERWLSECEPPFYGLGGRKRAVSDSTLLFRRTELTRAHSGAKSVFQLAGVGIVAYGSIRGMPLLPRLRAAGFAIWPFDPPVLPMVVEIFPRVFKRGLASAERAARERFLIERGVRQRSVIDEAVGNDDAFDALASLVGMEEALRREWRFDVPQQPDIALEGWIWGGA